MKKEYSHAEQVEILGRLGIDEKSISSEEASKLIRKYDREYARSLGIGNKSPAVAPIVLGRNHLIIAIVLIVMIILSAVFLAKAQVAATNLITAAPNFREVDGKLYNIEKSVLWMDFSGRVYGVASNIIIIGRGYIGRLDSHESLVEGVNLVQGRKVAIRNCTNGIAVGDQIKGRAMKVGVWDNSGSVLQLWDCGLPHRVAVLKTNIPPTISSITK